MEAKASANYILISPRKARLVADEIRGFELPEAVDILKNIPRKAAEILLKAVLSAGANAKVLNPDIKEEELFIKKVFIDGGPSLKRFNPRARGRADRILKRTSKITVVLSDE